MRRVINPRTRLGAADISRIQFDLGSRDEIPKLLMGLQHIYCTPDIKAEVFKILEEMVTEDVDKNNGRPGMDLWKILVLGTIRVNCNSTTLPSGGPSLTHLRMSFEPVALSKPL